MFLLNAICKEVFVKIKLVLPHALNVIMQQIVMETLYVFGQAQYVRFHLVIITVPFVLMRDFAMVLPKAVNGKEVLYNAQLLPVVTVTVLYVRVNLIVRQLYVISMMELVKTRVVLIPVLNVQMNLNAI